MSLWQCASDVDSDPPRRAQGVLREISSGRWKGSMRFRSKATRSGRRSSIASPKKPGRLWVEHMKMLMNEYRLNLGTAEASGVSPQTNGRLFLRRRRRSAAGLRCRPGKKTSPLPPVHISKKYFRAPHGLSQRCAHVSSLPPCPPAPAPFRCSFMTGCVTPVAVRSMSARLFVPSWPIRSRCAAILRPSKSLPMRK